MRAIVYTEHGGPDVLHEVERAEPSPEPGEVRVRVAVAGVNPTDWKGRRGVTPATIPPGGAVPGQDGAGTIDAVGDGVDPGRVGERVWLWETARQRTGGTAQELVVVPSDHAVALPAPASFDLGAAVGVPALTAHRCLTVGEDLPRALAPGALAGHHVLVAGGAGAVGHAAIELGAWAGATVIATVSSPEKAALARAAGAHHVVDYRHEDAGAAVRALAPGGVDVVVEVSPVANADLDAAVLATGGTVSVYADPGDGDLALPVRRAMTLNVRYQFVLLYTVSIAAKRQGIADVSAALEAGALRVGEAAGLPLHRFALADTPDAHRAVEAGAVGKVLIDVAG